MRPVIIVFAKAPRPGWVKTRLTPALTAGQAAEMHDAFVRDTLANIMTFEGADVELHTDIETDAWRDFPVPRRLQCEGDLGLKMFHALGAALAEGRTQALILGSDAPDLPLDHLRKLLASSADIALGPAGDGGYYAISARKLSEAMFARVSWSSPDALEHTLAECSKCKLSVEIGPTWNDVDTPADLPRLIGSGRARESSKTLARIGVPQISLE
jgi:uncharacterized protein